MNNDEFKEVPQGTEDNDINMSENDTIITPDMPGNDMPEPGMPTPDNPDPGHDNDEKSDFEDICYICRRPESVAGKMIHKIGRAHV